MPVVLLVIDKGPEPRSKVSSTKPFLNLSTTKSPDGGMDGVKRKRRREEGEGEGEGEEGGEGVKLIEVPDAGSVHVPASTNFAFGCRHACACVCCLWVSDILSV